MLYHVTYAVGPINGLCLKSKWGRQNYEVLINGRRFIDSDGRSGYKSIQGAKSSINNYLRYHYVGYYSRKGIMTEDEYKEMMKELMGTTPDKLIYIKKIDD